MVIPSPFVYWAQTESVVTLKVDLKNASKPNVKILDNNIKFSAHGTGARGDNQYEFSLDLFDSVKTVCVCSRHDIYLPNSVQSFAIIRFCFVTQSKYIKHTITGLINIAAINLHDKCIDTVYFSVIPIRITQFDLHFSYKRWVRIAL